MVKRKSGWISYSIFLNGWAQNALIVFASFRFSITFIISTKKKFCFIFYLPTAQKSNTREQIRTEEKWGLFRLWNEKKLIKVDEEKL